MLTVPLNKLEVVFSSTGTTGVPTFGGTTLDEGENIADWMARATWMMKHRPGTRMLGTMEPLSIHTFWHPWISLWGKAHGKMLGVEGARDSVCFPGTGISFFDEALARMPVDTYLVISDAVPYFIGQCAGRGKEPKEFVKLKHFCQSGDAITPNQRIMYREKFGTEDFWECCSVSEMFYLETECYVHNGSHIWADYWFVELIDPDTGEPLPPGERGEVVITSLFLKSMPAIRFATENFAWWTEDKCECGRTHPRIRTYDRTGYRVKVKDKTLIPYDVREVMERYPETAETNFNIIKYAEVMDTLRLRASYNPMWTKDPEELRERLVKDFKERLGVDAEIEWVSFDELAKILHKLIRVVDLTKEAK
jgi:phenylacetate-CoA ligase